MEILEVDVCMVGGGIPALRAAERVYVSIRGRDTNAKNAEGVEYVHTIEFDPSAKIVKVDPYACTNE